MAQWLKCLPPMQETWVQSVGQEDPLEKETVTHSSILPGESHGWRSLVGYSPWGRKESDTTERLHFLFCPPNPQLPRRFQQSILKGLVREGGYRISNPLRHSSLIG